MNNSVLTLNLTYNELLDEIKETLSLFNRTSCTPMDTFDRGCRSGAINFWYQLALKTSATDKQLHDDHNQLRLLAGLKNSDQELSADVS